MKVSMLNNGRIVRLLLFLLVISMTIPETTAQAKSLEEKGQIVANSIIQKYESSFDSLDLVMQKHYALRKYRILGDSSLFPFIVQDLKVTVSLIEDDLQNFSDSAYIAEREADLFEKLNPKTRKGRERRALFNEKREMLFYLNFLYNVSTFSDYNLHDSNSIRLLKECVQYLQRVDYESFLTDGKTVLVYAPQAVNYVYYLQQLGVTDFRGTYSSKFREIFNDSLDSHLSKRRFRDKIYGLTHIVISASRYYQEPVDTVAFRWIFNYFDENIDRIIRKTSSDIVAEVGICYKLGLYEQHKPLTKCIRKIIKDYNKKHNMILSTRGNSDIAKGEHRNILAVMLLSWGDRLFEGPDLSLYHEEVFDSVVGQNVSE